MKPSSEELVDHRFLSPDFLVQTTKFAGGVQVTVNLGPTPFGPESGTLLPPYGFRITRPEAPATEGRFRHQAVLDGSEVEF